MKRSKSNFQNDIVYFKTKSIACLKQLRIIIFQKIENTIKRLPKKFLKFLNYYFPPKINVKLEVDYLFGTIILEKFHDLETQNTMLNKFEVAKNVDEFNRKFNIKKGSEVL